MATDMQVPPKIEQPKKHASGQKPTGEKKMPTVLDHITDLVLSIASDDAPVPDDLVMFSLPVDIVPPCFKKFALTLYSAAKSSPSILVAQVVLLERLMKRLKMVHISMRLLHQLWLVSMVLAEKLVEDAAYFNSDFADLCELPVAHVNAMEVQFIKLICWDFFISGEQYSRVREAINAMASRKKRNTLRPHVARPADEDVPRAPTPPEAPRTTRPMRPVRVPVA